MRYPVSQLGIFFLLVTAFSLVGISCSRPTAQNIVVEKSSPNGVYRVKVEFKIEAPKGTLEYTERVSIQLLKGQTLLDTHEYENSDQYEYSLRQGIEVIEWVEDNVLRMGENSSDQPFYDELIVSNNLSESVSRMTVSYGRFESFLILDLGPGSKVVLRASPRFKPDGSSKYFVGYGGVTESGKKFEGVMEGKQRRSPAEGPLTFQIKCGK